MSFAERNMMRAMENPTGRQTYPMSWSWQTRWAAGTGKRPSWVNKKQVAGNATMHIQNRVIRSTNETAEQRLRNLGRKTKVIKLGPRLVIPIFDN